MTHNHSSPCLHDRQYGAPDEVVLCKCGNTPIPGYDECEDELFAFYMDYPEEADCDMDDPRLQSEGARRVYARVASERVRRFGEQVPVYRRSA
jgi:hypothetical protein